MFYFVISMVFAQQNTDEFIGEMDSVAQRVALTMANEEVFEDDEMRMCIEKRHSAILNLREMMVDVESHYKVAKQADSYRRTMSTILSQGLQLERAASLCGGISEIEPGEAMITAQKKQIQSSTVLTEKNKDLFPFDAYDQK